jgi:hypothetical protein
MGLLFRNYLDGVMIDRFAGLTLREISALVQYSPSVLYGECVIHVGGCCVGFFAMLVALLCAIFTYLFMYAALPDR